MGPEATPGELLQSLKILEKISPFFTANSQIPFRWIDPSPTLKPACAADRVKLGLTELSFASSRTSCCEAHPSGSRKRNPGFSPKSELSDLQVASRQEPDRHQLLVWCTSQRTQVSPSGTETYKNPSFWASLLLG